MPRPDDTDADVRKAAFDHDLEILPILKQFDSHAQIEFPLNAVNEEQPALWIDDRIPSFVNTYLSLHENAYELKGHMMQDQAARIQFPKYAAAATLEHLGQICYFISVETPQQFQLPPATSSN